MYPFVASLAVGSSPRAINYAIKAQNSFDQKVKQRKLMQNENEITN